MKRINYIGNLVQPTNIVVDIGCDHCFLAIYLLQHKKAKKIINIDINNRPLQQGIENLKKKHLLEYTQNILNDGLKDLNFLEKIDYAIISGLGACSIIGILEHNKLKIKNFILQANNKHEVLRNYLIKHFYRITSEHYIEDNKIIYVIFVVEKNLNLRFYSSTSYFFGHLKTIDLNQKYYNYLNNRLQFLNKKIKIKNVNNDLIIEYKLLLKRINYYECKRSL